MERYHEFIENLSANFSKYHELIEKKFGILCENGIIGKNEIDKYRETINEIRRESQIKQENHVMEYEKEIDKYRSDLDKMKEIEKEYQHLSIEHKHLQSKYEEMKSSQPRARSGSHSISIDHNKSGDEIEKLKDEIYELRKMVRRQQLKWDELKHTPAKYYVNDIDQKHRFSTDEYRNYWGFGLDNVHSKWRQK